jgi:hypothetical protein
MGGNGMGMDGKEWKMKGKWEWNFGSWIIIKFVFLLI